MKTIVTIVLICFSALYSYSQGPLKLSIIKGTEKPNTENEHFYLLEISNTSKATASFNISAPDKSCNNTKLQQTEMKQEIFDKQKSKTINTLNIPSGKTVEFYLKITRPTNAKQNSWNCTEIKAVTNNGELLSNIITIESLIPNPNDVN